MPVQKLLQLYQRVGAVGLAFWTTAVSILLSLIISTALGLVPLWLMGQMDHDRLVSSLLVTIAVPALVAPPVSWLVGALLGTLHQANEQLRVLAATDDVTGVLNRRGFLERSSSMIEAMRQPQYPVLAIVDLDRLKQLNEDHGHETGDQALRAVAERLLTVDGAALARFGGDEFAVLVPSSNGETPVRAMLTERLHGIVLTGGVRVQVSIGVATVEPGEPMDLALSRADQQLFRLKQSTRHGTPAAPVPHARRPRHRREIVS